MLLMEILFFSYAKIPFACTYVPGKAKLHLFLTPDGNILVSGARDSEKGKRDYWLLKEKSE